MKNFILLLYLCIKGKGHQMRESVQRQAFKLNSIKLTTTVFYVRFVTVMVVSDYFFNYYVVPIN